LKVIFLDIDGVLNNAACFLTGPGGLRARPDPLCIQALNRILRATRAKIVISSAWRKHLTEHQLAALLAKWKVAGRLIGTTPWVICAPRGAEIRAWLEQHPRVRQFVILDDDADMEDLHPHLVLTRFARGLTEAQATRAIQILERRNYAPSHRNARGVQRRLRFL
jgi:hypothetical protein